MLRVSKRPTCLPVSLEEAKAQLRVKGTDNDLLIKGLIGAATRHCETLVQRVFAPRTFQWVLPRWCLVLEVPIAPVAPTGIASIAYVDWATETQQTLDQAAYVVRPIVGGGVKIFPKFGSAWPAAFSYAAEPIVIEFDAGYADLEDLPPNVKVAILLQLRHLYSLGERSPTVIKESNVGIGETQWAISPDVKSLIPDAVTQLMLAEVW